MIDPLESQLGYQLRRASAVMMSELGTVMAAIGLRPTEATILILINANPGCTQSNLSRQLAIKRANMVPLMAGLMRRGLVARERMDGRSHALTLTQAGEALLAEVQVLVNAHEARFLAHVAPDRIEALEAALKAIRNAV